MNRELRITNDELRADRAVWFPGCRLQSAEVEVLMVRIAFRTTCGGDYGWGHWIRTLNLVEGLRDSGRCRSGVVVFDGPTAAIDLARERLCGGTGFEFHQLADRSLSEPGELFARDREFLRRRGRYDIVVIDRLLSDLHWLGLWRSVSERLGVFDDMGGFSGDADIVIRPQLLPESGRRTVGGEVLYGPRFFPVAREWLKLRRRHQPNEASKLVLCLGGGTTNRSGYLLAADALRLCDKIPREDIVFLLGYELSSSELADRIRTRLGHLEMCGSDDLPAVFATARLGLIAGGFLKYELAAAGVPSVIMSGPKHQEPLARAFAEAGGPSVYAGRIAELSPADLADTLARLWSDNRRLTDMSDAGMNLIDGQGTQRILQHLLFPRLADS